jgi:dipeptidyl-peptidase 4
VLRRTSDGFEIRGLEKSEINALTTAEWKFPEPFQGKASDGTTDLYGLIWKPTNFDPSKNIQSSNTSTQGRRDSSLPRTSLEHCKGANKAWLNLASSWS